MQIIPAPMAGWTDIYVRRVLSYLGAKEVWTEMISAAAICRGSKRTFNMLGTVKGVHNVVQLFGSCAKDYEDAIATGVLDDFDEININMGCPVKKVITKNGGVKLMCDIKLAEEIIGACLTGKKPVSVKMRLGWDKNNAVEFAKMCESAGCFRLIVHGRTGKQGYSGTADWEGIKAVVDAVKIPVVANGDITDLASARECLDLTKAAGVMVGRVLTRKKVDEIYKLFNNENR
ncbi:MAG: tRNA-dihydrouridine synthase family protein [Christensenellaceae bacterium]|jgi:nifR3 family TIM-barrel protein|nr:tRNA-dihydrouridine synthase family protein [Christensenellaceae bacterium]